MRHPLPALECSVAELTRRMMMMASRRLEGDLRERHLVVPDARSEAGRSRIAAQIATLNPNRERDAVLWIEVVFEFDGDESR